MKTNLEKLRDILCTVEEVEEDLKEVRFWSKVINKKSQQEYWINRRTRNWLYSWWKVKLYDNIRWFWTPACIDLDYFNIIWNEIHERHLRMYCESKDLIFQMSWPCLWIYRNHIDKNILAIQLDNKLSLENQSEETLWAIVKFLENNK